MAVFSGGLVFKQVREALKGSELQLMMSTVRAEKVFLS